MTNYSHNPHSPLPLGVPLTGKKPGGYYAESREYFEAESAVDWLGNRFHVGENVMYCVGAGRGQMMAVGKVLKIRYYDSTRNVRREARDDESYHTHGTSFRETHHDGQVFRWVWENVHYWEIEVQVHTARTSGAWDNEKRSKPAWPNPMNITALPINLSDSM